MILALRATLAIVALSCALTGAQAAAAPRSFFGAFPLDRGWVADLPPFNEHLTTDVGAFYLGFAILFGWASVRPQRDLVSPLAVAWGVTGLIHLGWHVAHLDRHGTGDAILQTAGLVAVLAPCVLAAMAFGGRHTLGT